MTSQLQDVLLATGKETELCRLPDGTRLLVMAHGGRALGLYSASNDANFYWTNTLLETPASAKAFYSGDGWHNSGGDRTWLAPEVDYFFPKYPSICVDSYWQPRELDPGSYDLARQNSGPVLQCQLSLVNYRTGENLRLDLTKTYAPAANPLRGSPTFADIEYAGYSLTTSLELLNEEPVSIGPVGLWNLVQLPHGGELFVATSSTTEPQSYFGSIRSGDLTVENHLVRYRMNAPGEQKIGISATAATGRAGYLYAAGDQMALVIRNFFINPSGDYVDLPWHNGGRSGDVVQACNVCSKWGTFSELEYHVPAIGGGTGRSRCDDTSQIWAFRGSKSSIEGIARLLLGGS